MNLLSQIALYVATAVADFITLMLLARFFMQWQRVSFRNQLGAFVIALTDWAVLPLRRVIPGLFGLDLASLLPALGAQVLLVLIGFVLTPFFPGVVGIVLGIFGLGLIQLVVMMTWLVFAVVFAAAVLSWVAPHSPVAPIFDALARPFIAPLRRVIPPVSGVDLSPLVLLLLLPILHRILEETGTAFSQFIVRL